MKLIEEKIFSIYLTIASSYKSIIIINNNKPYIAYVEWVV
ncbi:hypothetical protein M983_1113 [Proteus myxofaciens ATCC 19692]|uniref:Uncharacterized protein n=1 Tax=Proteus myxofaciens ATCC 19692 TaxID=1354337 RepID=A0A198GBS2_9GAMM|nr:hypothetical protein M983_1113 [Proteus myxofaciens ATCC 19692]